VKHFFIRLVRSIIRRFFKLSRGRFFLDPESWRIIRCRFDGLDYIHTWRGGALVWFEPTPQAVRITSEDLPLFLQHTELNLGQKVLIAGAGMGSEIWYFSEKVGRDGIVIAIEPDDDAYRRLSKLTKLLPYENVKLFKCAVAAKTGTAMLFSPDSSTVSNTIVESNNLHLKSQPVLIETIERICREVGINHLDYLKMNIEGSEFDALLGVGAIAVRHYCISCHDFLGEEFATKDDILVELLKQGYFLYENEQDESRPWVGSYVYAKSELLG
jgi:FkbM family methyltransferase